MALTEDQIKALVVALNARDYSAFATNVTSGAKSTDYSEVVEKFIEKLCYANFTEAVQKVNFIASVVQQNIGQSLTQFENALYNAFPSLSSSVPASPSAVQESESSLNFADMTLDDINDLLQKTKSEQALLIRTNKPLDPKKSELIKKLQVEKEKRSSEETNNSVNTHDTKSSDNWFNLASSKDVRQDLDFAIVEGTSVLQKIKERLDVEIREGHVALSPQEEIRKSQEKEYIDKFYLEMSEITDGNEFIKSVSSFFDSQKKITGHLLGSRSEIKHGGCFQVGDGWIVLLQRKIPDRKTPLFFIVPLNIPDGAYYTVKINRRYEGGNIMPDAFDIFEFKGNTCITLIESNKGVEVIEERYRSLLANQVRGYGKTFKDIVAQLPREIKDLKPQISAIQAFVQAAKKNGFELDESMIVGNSDADLFSKATPQEMDREISPPNQQTEAEDERNEAQSNEDEKMAFNPNDPTAKKIVELEKLLEQAKFSKQTSTVKRLEEDIAKLRSEQNPQITAESDSSAAESAEVDQDNKDEEDPDENFEELNQNIKSELKNSILPQEIQDLINAAFEAKLSIKDIKPEQAKELLNKYYLKYNYKALLDYRDQLLQDSDMLNVVTIFDDYLSIYIELAYIAGNYNEFANKELEDCEKLSNKLSEDQDKLIDEFNELDKKDLSTSELKKKQEIKDKIYQLQKEGNKITLRINRAQILLSGDISEIEKHFPDCEHLSFRGIKGGADSHKDQLIEDYKSKLKKVGGKIAEKSKKKFALQQEDLTDEDIENIDLKRLTADEIADIAVAAGEPVDLADKGKADAVLDLVDQVRKFDKYLGSFFKNIDKHKLQLNNTQKDLDKTQREIIKLEEDVDLIKIANKVKLTPIQEKKRLIQEKIDQLEDQESKSARLAEEKLQKDLRDFETREKYLSIELNKSLDKLESQIAKLKSKLQTQVNKYHSEQTKLIGAIYKLAPDSVGYAQNLHDQIIELCKQYPLFYAQLIKDGHINPNDSKEEVASDEYRSEGEEENYLEEEQNDEVDNAEQEESDNDSVEETNEEDSSSAEEDKNEYQVDSSQADSGYQPPKPGAITEPQGPEPVVNQEQDAAEEESDYSSSEDIYNDSSKTENIDAASEEQGAETGEQEMERTDDSKSEDQSSSENSAEGADEDEENKILDQVYEEVQDQLINRETVHSIDSARDTIQPERFSFASKIDRVKVQSEISYAAEDLKTEAAEVAEEYQDILAAFMKSQHEILMNNARTPQKLSGPSHDEVITAIKSALDAINETTDQLTMNLIVSCCKTEFRIQAETIQAIVPALQSGQTADEIVKKLVDVQKISAEKINGLVLETAKILGLQTK